MRVYIDGKIHDSLDKPIVVIFDEGEKDAIRNLKEDSKYFSSYNIDEVSVSRMEDLLGRLKEELSGET